MTGRRVLVALLAERLHGVGGSLNFGYELARFGGRIDGDVAADPDLG